MVLLMRFLIMLLIFISESDLLCYFLPLEFSQKENRPGIFESFFDNKPFGCSTKNEIIDDHPIENYAGLLYLQLKTIPG
jgi:hypothetical protein